MTATVTIKTRGWPATVVTKTAVEGEEGHVVTEKTTEVPPRSEFHIHVEDHKSFEVFLARAPEDAAEPVAPSAEELMVPEEQDLPAGGNGTVALGTTPTPSRKQSRPTDESAGA